MRIITQTVTPLVFLVFVHTANLLNLLLFLAYMLRSHRERFLATRFGLVLFFLLMSNVGGGALYGFTYPIDRLEIRYNEPDGRLPTPEAILATTIAVTEAGGVLGAADGDGQAVEMALGQIPRGSLFTDTGLQEILGAVVQHLNRNDFFGVYVITDQTQIDPRTGRDRREEGDTGLTLVVYVGQIREIQTVAKGDRLGERNPVNSEDHARLLQYSPLQSRQVGSRPDLFRKQALDDYLRRLNRHPGRRVDATIASSGEPGLIDLHYLVTENRPWYAYAMASNTGTKSVGEWQFRAGAGHQQLTGRDDVLTFDYEAADVEKSYSTLLGYQFPLVFPDYVKVSLFGSYSEFQGEEFGVGTILNFSGRSLLGGGELRISPWKIAGFAHSYFVGLRLHAMEVRQEIFLGTGTGESVASTLGQQDLTYLYGGAEFQRRGQFMETNMQLSVEGPLNKVSDEALSNLGRLDADRAWMIFEWNFQHDFFLEPLFFPQRFRDLEDWQTSTMAHELSFRVRGQYVLTDDRIIPQQQFVLGGFRSVRGYPESLAAADHGWFIQSEYRVHIPRLLKPYSAFPREERPAQFRERWNVRPPRPLIAPDWNLMARAFMDFGQTENVRVEAFETNQELWSTGLGLELQLGKYINLRTDVGMVLSSLDEFDSGSGGRQAIAGAQHGDIRTHLQASFLW